ncbi:MAG: hypothetical protein GY711_20770 [bacterium]|nr:hypothetical protein [bacterium]
MAELLAEPERRDSGWWRLPLRDVPPPPPRPDADWQRAWHGSVVEAVYSVLYHGRLWASAEADHGERFFDGCPGVYCFRDTLAEKAEAYCVETDLFDDGIFWSCKWELDVDRPAAPPFRPSLSRPTERENQEQAKTERDRSARVPLSFKRTDQWAQRPESVRLVALWVRCRTSAELPSGAWAAGWAPLLEACPWKPKRSEVAVDNRTAKNIECTTSSSSQGRRTKTNDGHGTTSCRRRRGRDRCVSVAQVRQREHRLQRLAAARRLSRELGEPRSEAPRLRQGARRTGRKEVRQPRGIIDDVEREADAELVAAKSAAVERGTAHASILASHVMEAAQPQERTRTARCRIPEAKRTVRL